MQMIGFSGEDVISPQTYLSGEFLKPAMVLKKHMIEINRAHHL